MRRTGAAIVLAAMLSSCSFVFVSGPPPNHEQVPAFRCTSGKAMPIVDAIVVAALVVATFAVVNASDQQWHDIYCPDKTDASCMPPGKTAAIATYAGIAAVMAPSAIFGFYTTNECSDAKLALKRRSQEPAAGAPPAPNDPNAPPPPPIGNPPPGGPPVVPPPPPAQGSASTSPQ